MLNRWIELWERRQLLFTPKQYPKYMNNKLRVFKPSVAVKAAILMIAGYSLWILKEQTFPSQIVIEYPKTQDLEQLK